MVLAALLCGFLSGGVALARERTKTLRVPILMEEATVRGKVIILETREDDRKVASSIRVRLFTERRTGEDEKPVRELLHEARTDDLGLFDLPSVPVGEYQLWVSGLQVRLRVVPRTAPPKPQDDPKVLLILLPREALLQD
jgi:hypothetical protein